MLVLHAFWPEVTANLGVVAILEMLSDAVPVLVNVTDFGELVVVKGCPPNERLLGWRLTAGPEPVPNNPKTPTPVVVPTKTLPFAIMGVMNLFPFPKLSRPLGACDELYSSWFMSAALYA